MIIRPEKIKILIVEDHSLLRESLAELLDFQPDFTVVAGVNTLGQSRKFLENQVIDVILFDYDLGSQMALELLGSVEQLTPAASVLVLANEISRRSMNLLESKGAKGIFWKTTGFRDLIRAIRHLGMQPSEYPTVKSICQSGTRPTFTKRQLDVASAVLLGWATKEIAGALRVTDGAVKSTMQQLFAKTRTRSRPQLVRTLLEQNLVTPEDQSKLEESLRAGVSTGTV